MTTPDCVTGCGRPAHEGHACDPCVDRARRQLAGDPRDPTWRGLGITEAAPAARAIARRQTRDGAVAGGVPGPRLPIEPGASETLDAVGNTLTTWARHVAGERGIEIPNGGIGRDGP